MPFAERTAGLGRYTTPRHTGKDARAVPGLEAGRPHADG
jgi:hypothetical protein